MTLESSRKRKEHSNINWKSKIVRNFIDSWVESDNPKGAANIPIEEPETNGPAALSQPKSVAPKEKSTKQHSYPNFVKSHEKKPTSNVKDPGLEERDIQRLKNVVRYMYNKDKVSLKLTFEQAGMLLEPSYDEQTKIFRFLINDREICQAEGEQQEAHTKARDKLEQILQYYCYTVKRLKEFHTRRNVFRKQPETQGSKQTYKDKQLDEGNIGFRLLQKQGWSGGSLGNTQAGILEPIGVQKKKDKAGLGAEESDRPEKIPIEAFLLVIKQYAAGNALYDLVFSPQFSKHQVIKLKDYASTLKLFPQTIGKKKQLVISKKLTLEQIRVGVLKGHSDLCAKYAVIPPICETCK